MTHSFPTRRSSDLLEESALEAKLAGEAVDITLPSRPAEVGRIHPISQTFEELVAIFGEMGFSVAEGPHIEEDYYNFTALNIHEAHQARQEMDTFYMRPAADGSRKVLRKIGRASCRERVCQYV